jgi:methionine sulfoxide reductase heme-binding subunit
MLPLALLIAGAVRGTLSPNPINDITVGTGLWTLRFLLITLAITPLAHLTGLGALVRFRRMLGLLSFFYGSLHFLTYLWLDQFFDLQAILNDIPRRPFIAIGFASFVLMIPLAVSSADRVARQMGMRTWKLVHRLAYGAAVGGVVHYLWLVKADTRGPLVYGVLLAVLLASRAVLALRSKREERSDGEAL